ncbi:hypothetical protein [uncultured Sphingomonas sp.]|uniref:hypothetical protein n=1 Tax=uncultured Sphingomonas sp. TaxID=158754 RepID=UPI0025F39EE2|nr:hypothetical protein [uncultured Sphingomonas sp.]
MNLLMDVERFMNRTGMRPSTLGRRALGDPNLVRSLRNGRELRPATADRLRSYILQADAR